MSKAWHEVIGNLLEESKFNFSQFNDTNGYTLTFEGVHIPLSLLIFTTEESNTEEACLTIIGRLPYTVPQNEVNNLLHFINGKNIEMAIGSYELHPSRKISFRLGNEIWPDFNVRKLKSLIYLSATALDDLDIEIRSETSAENPKFIIPL